MSETILLPHKPDAPLSYRFVPGHGPLSTTHLIVFLNGLIVPQAGWQPTIDKLQRDWAGNSQAGEAGDNRPPLLTYDRYGQGESARDPADDLHGGTHDIFEVIRDLHILTKEIWATKVITAIDEAPLPSKLVFVANSIGCVIARLYAEAHPGTVAGLLLLDSNIANSDLVSIFPDPDAPDFDPAVLPEDVTVEDLRRTRASYALNFRPEAPNPEHLDRSTIAAALPYSDAPSLLGEPRIIVVGHDWETFAEEGLRGSMNVPKSLTNKFMNPAWTKYNEGLTRLTSAGRAAGPIIAANCGHFIQKDDPWLVALLINELIEAVG
ncbi:alpha/beta-hydrolase [Hypomontagnella submonticulosa]|nr:alpha/beta-hydrolase [Hypomontagnella submonticulosa]